MECLYIYQVSDNRKNYLETLKSQLSSAKMQLEEAGVRGEERSVQLEAKSRELSTLARKLDSQDKLISELQVIKVAMVTVYMSNIYVLVV